MEMRLNDHLNFLREKPQLVPLSDQQKESFLKVWNRFQSYEKRREFVGEIPDLYHNRNRYRSLLDEKDREIFDKIQEDPDTRF